MSLGIHHRLPKHTISDFLVKVVTVLENPDVNLLLLLGLVCSFYLIESERKVCSIGRIPLSAHQQLPLMLIETKLLIFSEVQSPIFSEKSSTSVHFYKYFPCTVETVFGGHPRGWLSDRLIQIS